MNQTDKGPEGNEEVCSTTEVCRKKTVSYPVSFVTVIVLFGVF